MGCHFLLQGIFPSQGSNPGLLHCRRILYQLSYKGSPLNGIPVLSHSVVSNSLRPHGLQPARLLCPWDFPGKKTGVGCHFLLQGIFPTQVSNLSLLCFLHWQVGSLPLSHPGSPAYQESLSEYRCISPHSHIFTNNLSGLCCSPSSGRVPARLVEISDAAHLIFIWKECPFVTSTHTSRNYIF